MGVMQRDRQGERDRRGRERDGRDAWIKRDR